MISKVASNSYVSEESGAKGLTVYDLTRNLVVTHLVWHMGVIGKLTD